MEVLFLFLGIISILLHLGSIFTLASIKRSRNTTQWDV